MLRWTEGADFGIEIQATLMTTKLRLASARAFWHGFVENGNCEA